MNHFSGIAIDDLLKLSSVASPNVSVDGEKLAYVKTSLDESSDRYYANLLYRNLKTGTIKKLTDDFSQNELPLWAPNGKRLLFLSDKSGQRQAYLLSGADRSPKQITFSDQDVRQIMWHPDGRRIIFSTKIRQTKSAQQPTITKIKRINYKSDAEGIINPSLEDKICIQSIDERKFSPLVDYSIGYGLRRFCDISSDGRYLLCERELDRDDDFNFDTGLWELDLVTKQLRRVTILYSKGIFGEAAYSPDGRYIAMFGNPKRYQTPNQFSVYLYDRVRDDIEDLLTGRDIQLGDWAVGDFLQKQTCPFLQWSDNGRFVYFSASVDGYVELCRVSLDGRFSTVTNLHRHLSEFVLLPDSKEAVVALSAPDLPSELYCFDLIKHRLGKPLTNTNESIMSQRRTAEYDTFHYVSFDGEKLGGFFVYPTSFVNGKHYPLILNIHGGPYMMHCATFFHEVQVMASSGYAILLLNPRGSFGYGQLVVSQVTGHYGEGDYYDLMKGLDIALKRYPFIDPTQLFVTGGSYGGFMTNWMVSHTNRFKAAVTQRSMSNFISLFGTGDIGYHFFIDELNADIHDYKKLWKHSPLAYVDRVETPILILQSENDNRCPMEQAEQWFVALKFDKKVAEFVRFPHSTHELSRKGDPSLRIKRLSLIIDWFEKYRSAKVR